MQQGVVLVCREARVSKLPSSVDRMPVALRDKRAGPMLDPDEVVAQSLNAVTYVWWRAHKNSPPVDETSVTGEPVSSDAAAPAAADQQRAR